VTALLVVLAAGAGSYAFRVGAVVVIDRFSLPSWFDRMSAFIMPAVFAALAVGSLAAPVDEGMATATPVLAGGFTTAAIARRRSAATAMVAGMSVLCAVRALVAAVVT
jgi:branched-subunit amino acid transport protein